MVWRTEAVALTGLNGRARVVVVRERSVVERMAKVEICIVDE